MRRCLEQGRLKALRRGNETFRLESDKTQQAFRLVWIISIGKNQCRVVMLLDRANEPNGPTQSPEVGKFERSSGTSLTLEAF
jgi:hypothetical protein